MRLGRRCEARTAFDRAISLAQRRPRPHTFAFISIA